MMQNQVNKNVEHERDTGLKRFMRVIITLYFQVPFIITLKDTSNRPQDHVGSPLDPGIMAI